MTVEPGFGGQKYIPASTARIREARQLIDARQAHVDIEVDGGITRDNVQVVLDAGANIIVAGSAIFQRKYSRKREKYDGNPGSRPGWKINRKEWLRPFFLFPGASEKWSTDS